MGLKSLTLSFFGVTGVTGVTQALYPLLLKGCRELHFVVLLKNGGVTGVTR